MADVVHDVCVSCGRTRPLKFCEHCGEKRITAHDYSIVHFSEHVVETITHFDIKSLRAFRVMAVQPGELTRAYLHGRRKPFVGPIQLFVIINVVFALLGANTFRTPLRVQRGSWMAETKERLVAERRVQKSMTEQEFEHSFDATATTQAKSWIFMMIPAYAFVLAVLYGFRRYFFEHLVFATHFMTFVLAWIIVGGAGFGLSLKLLGVRMTSQQFDNIISLVLLIGMIGYLFLALRRAYGDRWYAAAARALTMGVVFLPVLLAYRLMLFFVTLYWMH